ncbi:HtaA domain-containing protein, partial [Microbacterium sp. NPDC008134]|uniref:HtaA domain-containing protein n=1 Tax=Microbacterium sp. NPDC008134 TaxID=3364183 RepID=UPI0036E66109
PSVSGTVKTASTEGLTVTTSGANLGASVTGAYVALIEAGTEADVTAGGGFAAMQFVRDVSGGAFSVDLVAAKAGLDRSKSYEVIVWQQHTMPNASTIYARQAVTVSDAQWNSVFPPVDGPTVKTTVKSATAEKGLTVTATGSKHGSITGAYVALIEKGTEADVTAEGGFVAMQFVRSVAGGSYSVDLTAAASKLDRTKSYEVISWQQHTMPTASTIYARSTVTVTEAQWDAIFGKKPETPKPPVTPTAPVATVPGGSLRWDVSTSFLSYITGNIAKGAIEVTGGATRADGLFQFGQATGSTYDPATGLGTVSYVGAVRFTGHGGVLDVTIANPQIRITSANAATLYVTNGGSQVPFATLDLSRAGKTTANGAVTYTSAPASITSAGIGQVFQGYSTNLSPVTFTIGSAAAAPSGSTGTVAAAAAVVKKAALPATPPATTGIEIDDENLVALQSGKSATITASGFEPNEKDIQVVVYSTPVLLGTVDADANGVATWTGTLPATLENGEHTLTLQGSVTRGLVFTLDRETVVIGACTVEGASLNWGYKESFRTYIEGIAKGGWTLTDVVYQYPDFVWSNGSGSFDDETGAGLVTYGGSIQFTGHDGALNTTLANFRVELAGDTGYIVVDVVGRTQNGEAIDLKDVRFAEFSLADVIPVDGVITLDGIPSVLTEAGAAAFGTYAAGEQLDPVSAVIPVGADCGVAAPVDEEEAEPEATTSVTVVTEVADEQGGVPVWVWIVGGLVVVALVGTGGVLIGRRSRSTAEQAVTTTEV